MVVATTGWRGFFPMTRCTFRNCIYACLKVITVLTPQPKVTTPTAINLAPEGPDGDVHITSEPTSPFRSQAPPVRQRSTRRAMLPHTLSHDALGLRNTTHPSVPPIGSAPVTPDERHEQELHEHMLQHAHVRSAWSTCHSHGSMLRSAQYADLFLLEPHEYDYITDGELVRLYDRGVIDGRILEQIVDASIRIQRACTDADRAVSIKTRRAMIRHALED